MSRPDLPDADAALEFAAQLIEERSITDLGGTFPRGKRVREDAELRRRVRMECRKESANLIRAFKGRRDLDSVQVLRRISERKHRADLLLKDAWPLAWKGWLNIYCSIKCNSKGLPPETEYRIEIAERGAKVLAADAAGQPIDSSEDQGGAA